MPEEQPKKLDIRPSTSTTVGATLGIPAGIVIVWIIKTFFLPPDLELPVEVASAIGAIVAQLVGLPFTGGRAVDTE